MGEQADWAAIVNYEMRLDRNVIKNRQCEFDQFILSSFIS
jgi:hypothetical protein